MTEAEHEKLDRALTRGIKRARKNAAAPGQTLEQKIRQLGAAQRMEAERHAHRLNRYTEGG